MAEKEPLGFRCLGKLSTAHSRVSRIWQSGQGEEAAADCLTEKFLLAEHVLNKLVLHITN